MRFCSVTGEQKGSRKRIICFRRPLGRAALGSAPGQVLQTRTTRLSRSTTDAGRGARAPRGGGASPAAASSTPSTAAASSGHHTPSRPRPVISPGPPSPERSAAAVVRDAAPRNSRDDAFFATRPPEAGPPSSARSVASSGGVGPPELPGAPPGVAASIVLCGVEGRGSFVTGESASARPGVPPPWGGAARGFIFFHLCLMASSEKLESSAPKSGSRLIVRHRRPCFSTPRRSAAISSFVHSLGASPVLALACAWPVPSSTNSRSPRFT